MAQSKNSVQIKLLASSHQKGKYKISCHTMWQDIFGDSDSYMEYYMDWKWRGNQVLILEEEERGALYSMLHMNPYSILQAGRQRRLQYIVGVSTREDQRGRGYMGMLLREMFRILYERGEEWTYLMPAAEEIYLPYGFCGVYYAEPVEGCFSWGETGGMKDEEKDGKRLVYPFGECEEEKREELVTFARNSLGERFQVYPMHDQAYFQEIAQEMEACGGELLVLESGGRVIGYGEYMYEEGEAFPVEFGETVLAAGREEEGIALLKEYLLKKIFGWKKLPVRFSESAFLSEDLKRSISGEKEREKVCRIMVRVIHFKRAARSLAQPKGWSDQVVCRIQDSFILENNGIWELSFEQKGTKVKKTEKTPDFCLSIEDFTKLLFQQYSVYINDLV